MVVKQDAEGLTDVAHCPANCAVLLIVAEQLLHNMCCLGVTDDPLVLDLQAEGHGTGDGFSPGDFAVKDELDTVAVAVAFVLGYRQADVDVQPAIRRLRVVVLLGGLPGDAVGVQNLLNLVVVRHTAEPAV